MPFVYPSPFNGLPNYDADGDGIIDAAENIDKDYIAFEDIDQFKVVKIHTSNTVKIVSNDDGINDVEATIGFATMSALAGNTIIIRTEGSIENPLWTLIPNEPIFLGLNGDITQTVPTTGTWLQIGIAESTNSILIRVEDAILL